MKLSEVYKIIENHYPKHLAMDWDNVGILAGKPDMEIRSVLTTLDITPDVVREAADAGCELILSHHPLLFDGVKNFTEDNFKVKMYAEILRNNMAVISMHTNMDCAENGINQRLAEMLGFSDITVLEDKTGLGRIGNIEKCGFYEYAKKVKDILHTPFLKVSGDANRMIERVAVGSGACSDVLPDAIAKGADLLITGDVKYHIAIEAVQSGINIIDAGHYPTEVIVTEMFEEILKDSGLIIVKSKNKDIFSCV